MNNLEFMSAILVAVFASNGLWGFIQSRVNKRDKTRSALEEGLLALLHDKMYNLCEKYLVMGEITLEELNNLKCLFKPYERLGGNGIVKETFERCKKLPIVEEHNAQER